MMERLIGAKSGGINGMALTQVETVLVQALRDQGCSFEVMIIVLQSLKTQQEKFQFLKWVVTDYPDEQMILDRIMDIIHTRT